MWGWEIKFDERIWKNTAQLVIVAPLQQIPLHRQNSNPEISSPKPEINHEIKNLAFYVGDLSLIFVLLRETIKNSCWVGPEQEQGLLRFRRPRPRILGGVRFRRVDLNRGASGPNGVGHQRCFRTWREVGYVHGTADAAPHGRARGRERRRNSTGPWYWGEKLHVLFGTVLYLTVCSAWVKEEQVLLLFFPWRFLAWYMYLPPAGVFFS